MERSKKNALFHTLLHKTNLREHKEALLSPFGVESVTELKENEIDALIERLKELPDKRRADVPKEILNLRSKVILAAEVYMNTKIATPETWQRFNALMLDKRVCGKMLWEMNFEELKTVHVKLQVFNRAATKKRQEENYIAGMN